MAEYRPHGHSETGPPPVPPQSDGTNPMQWVWYLLRGRWYWAILLGLILAGAVGYFRYQQVSLLYRTEGKVYIQQHMPTLLYSNTPVTGDMPNFGSFMDNQMRTLKKPRVVDMAMSSERWRALDKPYTPRAQKKFRERLSVSHRGGMIYVRFTHPDRETTKVAVRAVIEVYQQIFNEEDPTRLRRRLTLLDERRQDLTTQLESLRREIEDVNADYTPEGVNARYDQKLNTINTLQERIDEVQQQIATTKQQLEEGAPEPTLDQLAENNTRLAALQREMTNRQRRLKRIRERYGGEHAAIEPLESQIKVLERRIDTQVKQAGVEEAKQAWKQKRQRRIEDAKARLKAIGQQLTQAKNEVATLSDKKARLSDLRNQAQQTKSKLEPVQGNIERINVESAMGDRFQVVDYGRSIEDPINEQEPYKKAMVGSVLGGGSGVALVLLLGLLRPRLRRSGDLSLACQDVTVLGMLPQLPERLDDPDWAYFAGRCVHKIRMLLQLEGRGEDLRSFVITGAGTGTGKTSLTMALGFSYAAAGAKTLMVDCDLVGGGLTRRLEVSRVKRLGRLLQEEGLVAADAVEEVANDLRSTKPLGEKLVDAGLISRADIDRVLELQQQSRAGLLDVLAGEPLDYCVSTLPVANLNVLSVGNATAEHVSRVGRKALRQFLDEVRHTYEVVLIDTGPAPGSVETSLIAAEADRVVLTASRGDAMNGLSECHKFLKSIGARIAGVVYNRAEGRDVELSRYSVGTSVRSVSQNSEAGRQRALAEAPVVTAVAGDGFSSNGGSGSSNGNDSSNGTGNGKHLRQ